MNAQPAKTERAAGRPAVSPTDLAMGAVVLVWGFGYVTFKLGQNELPTALFNLIRYVIAAPLLWIVLLRSGEDWRMPRKDWPRTLATGLIGVFVYSLVFSTAAKLTSAANTSLLLALSPIWGVVMGWLGGKGAPSLRFALGSLVAFGGAAMVIGFGATKLSFDLANWQGDLLAVAASVIWAWYGIVAQPLLKSHSGTKVQAWINTVALTGFLLWQTPAAFAFNWGAVSLKAWLSVSFVALFVTVFAHIIWYTAIARVGPERTMLAMYLVPAFAAVFGAVVLGQPFGPIQILGAVVAIGGVTLVRRA